MEINCSYLKELKCSGNHACGNSGHCPNFKKNKQQLTEMVESTVGHQLPLATYFLIDVTSHIAIFVAVTLIAIPIQL
jgi:hypothetical protein